VRTVEVLEPPIEPLKGRSGGDDETVSLDPLACGLRADLHVELEKVVVKDSEGVEVAADEIHDFDVTAFIIFVENAFVDL